MKCNMVICELKFIVSRYQNKIFITNKILDSCFYNIKTATIYGTYTIMKQLWAAENGILHIKHVKTQMYVFY